MDLKFAVIVVLAVFGWTISDGSTAVRKCTSDIPLPHSVQIDNCHSFPCNVSAGTVANITVKFSPANDTEKLHAEVIAYVNQDAFPFDMPADIGDVCKHLGGSAKCPLKAGENVTYTLALPMDKTLPDLFVETEVAIVDENKTCVTCFVIDIQLLALKEQSEKV